MYVRKFGKLSSGHRTGKVSFHSNTKEKQCPQMFKLLHNCTHLTHQQSNAQNLPSQASIVHDQALPDVQTGFRKGRGTRDQIVNSVGSQKKQEHSRKTFTSASLSLLKPLTVWSQQTVENSLRDGNTRPPYLPPEKSVCRPKGNRTRHGTMDWFKLGKEVHQGYILSPCVFNFYVEYIMQNAGLDEA